MIFASDHGWYELKEALCKHFADKAFEVENIWTFSDERVDFPLIAQEACKKVLKEDAIWMLVCWTWIGMSIVANKIKWIRAAKVNNSYEAEKAKQHNDANVLCFGWRTIGIELAIDAIQGYLNTEFSWWRYAARNEQLSNIELWII